MKLLFIKSVFEKSSIDYQFIMITEGFIIPSEKQQIKFFKQYLLNIGRIINDDRYNEIRLINLSNKIGENIKKDFIQTAFKKANIKYQCIMLSDGLISLSKEEQIELFNIFLPKIKFLDIWNYDEIKSIVQSNKLEESVKFSFIKSVFVKADLDCQFEILTDFNLINTNNELFVTNLFQEYLSNIGNLNDLNYNNIKSILISANENLKSIFIKSVYNKGSAEYRYKILFEDNFIDIQNESKEKQIELLDKLERLDINKIKSIAQSDKLDESVKLYFIKIVFEVASIQYKFIMLDEGLIILSGLDQLELLQKYILDIGSINDLIYERIKSIIQINIFDNKEQNTLLNSIYHNASAKYQFKFFFDNLITLTEVNQIELLKKCLLMFSNINELNYERIKAVILSNKLNESVKPKFIQSVFEIANSDCKYRILFEDNLIDIQKESYENQLELLQNLVRLDINKIKSIAKSDNIDESVKYSKDCI